MNATLTSNQTATAANVSATNSKTAIWEAAEKNRFGIVPFLLVLIACLGGYAGAIAVQENPIMLAVIAAVTGLTEALILSVASMRAIIISSAIVVAISLSVILF